MDKVKGLICRECGSEYPADPIHVCEFCFGPLEVNYNYENIKKKLTRKEIEKGPKSLWRYIDLLPVKGDALVGSNAGFTPMVKAKNLGNKLGLDELYLKNDTVNHPTLSFKDRVVAIALTKAKEFGFDTVACASTGNLANSVAAHAAEAGLKCYVFIPGDLEAGKVLGSLVYNPTLVAVNGNYDDVNRLCSEIAGEYRWAFVNINIRPYYAEGSKTLAYETAEQLGWRAPDQVVVPVASGSLLTKIWKGFKEFQMLGIIKELHTVVNGAQAYGCSPVAAAFKAGTEFIKPVKPNTIAKSIAIGNPADGYYSLKAVKESKGVFETVTDDEAVEGIKLLAATEGIFAETAGGVTVATLKKLAEAGKIKKRDMTVAYITGNGLKTQEAVVNSLSSPLKIEPHLSDFQEKLNKLES
ncbi:MAG: threonine synthase [Candidatus Schekmanbacteria bacterium RIFCSPHIGHO2_02_FULL_38_11]|uniref:Threonine synthase n=1 Tax=Candidatus Schekmanbacteria bacterium RIFCSPLOWO2_12_FULL_38_15 TaxID=1817883 RepID=A0A1F7SFW6_9BACT|nr:MAG: threonine synthase [Candidatus Schekmanbacteria bacterium GWA2_38_9]OGL49429.1 MAG: threonine synthase [Candidatus Schekmanbacteria bacterium RIFCSPLOWO2_02_FULL_38_14]OGL50666.1 MAG: threonine synthase [Candidatus Schekmanbacteria bacterium RIFCSPHIGHO2_02_FULL_38_11]OGL52696.1 MAG: threonine synthase [Candidatus Schekmanbacteria bacterium RIFCSPLOWO2_12_FULL_38_15]